MPHKIGIYVRVSTEEQAQVVDGSIDSQQHRLKNFLDLKNLQEKNWGKLVETYIDDGYSAKDTRRPAYQRMMRDIRLKKIDLILVTDISRLSRNIPDFCLLLKDLEEHKAKFFSVKEQFDTSTPAGEMMIYNMINLAQFERKQTSERVSQNFHSRALRGLLNGCNPLLGFDKDPTNSGKLLVQKNEVPLVRKIFETYLESASLQETAKKLMAFGIPRKEFGSRKISSSQERKWTIGALRNVLTNLAYIGKREINRGNKDESQEHLKPWQRYQIVNAAWPSIIDEETFQSVQNLLEENRQKERTRLKGAKKRFYLLTGILSCGECGNSLMGQTSHGRNKIHRYYGHKKLAHVDINCKYKRFKADDIEELISLETDIELAFKLYSEMNGNTQVLPLIKDKLEKLADRKKKLSIYKDEIGQKMNQSHNVFEMRSHIEERAIAFKRGWSKATPMNQKRLLRRLVNGLIFTSEGLYTHYVTSIEEEAIVHKEKITLAMGDKSVANFQNSNVINFGPHIHHGMLEGNGTLVVRNGGDGRTTDAPLLKRPKYLDIIEFSPFDLKNIFAICLPFYEKGSSLREIERLTNISKSTIRNAFECAGHPLRSTSNRQLPFLATPKFMRSGTTPYGYTYLEGTLVKDPKEYRNVQKIYLLWQKGESFRSIARRLNVHKLTTRSGKKWNHEIIKRIIERQKSLTER